MKELFMKNGLVTQLFIDLWICHEFSIDPVVYYKKIYKEVSCETQI